MRCPEAALTGCGATMSSQALLQRALTLPHPLPPPGTQGGGRGPFSADSGVRAPTPPWEHHLPWSRAICALGITHVLQVRALPISSSDFALPVVRSDSLGNTCLFLPTEP